MSETYQSDYYSSSYILLANSQGSDKPIGQFTLPGSPGLYVAISPNLSDDVLTVIGGLTVPPGESTPVSTIDYTLAQAAVKGIIAPVAAKPGVTTPGITMPTSPTGPVGGGGYG